MDIFDFLNKIKIFNNTTEKLFEKKTISANYTVASGFVCKLWKVIHSVTSGSARSLP